MGRYSTVFKSEPNVDANEQRRVDGDSVFHSVHVSVGGCVLRGERSEYRKGLQLRSTFDAAGSPLGQGGFNARPPPDVWRSEDFILDEDFT